MAKYPESLDEMPPRPRTWRRFIGRHLPSLSVTLLAALLMATILFPYIVITVPSGSVGVLWKRFNGYDLYCWCFVGRGTILDPRELRDEGLHVIWPWDKLYIYTLRLQSSTQTYNAITKDGVNVTAQINVRFQLLHNYVAVLHKFIGPQYLASVVEPELGSRAREIIAQYTAQEVYTSREAIQTKIRADAQKSLSTHLNSLVQPEAMEQPDPKHYNDFLQNSIQLLDALVLGIELPPEIVAAINRQTQQYYEIQEYKYRVEREAQEIDAQTDRGKRHSRLPANGERGNFGFVPPLARYRSNACARPVAQFESRHYWQWQGRPAAHSRQRGGVGGIKLQSQRHRGRYDAQRKGARNLSWPDQHTAKTNRSVDTREEQCGCNCIDAGRRHANADGCGADRASAVRSVEYQGLYATASRMAQVGHIGTGTGAGAWSWSAAQAVIGEGIAGERYD